MKNIVRCLAMSILLVGCVPALAVEKPTKVVVFADSIGRSPNYAESNWPAQLQRFRPDLDVINRSVGGHASYDALEYVEHEIDEFCGRSQCLVLIQFGINDGWRDSLGRQDSTPEETVWNLRTLSRYARSKRRDSIVLTPTPVCPDGLNGHGAAVQEYSRRVSERMLSQRRFDVFDVRGRVEFYWHEVIPDCVHPDQEGADRLAEIIAEMIPR